MAQTSISSFWLKRIAVMAAVIVVAIGFLIFIPEPGSASVASVSSENVEDSNDSSVAASVSRFYAEFRMTSRDPIKERYGDYVIVLDEESSSVDTRISGITEKNYPPNKNWQGDYKERPFTTDSTLRKEATNFAAQEGYTLVWDLSQDFVIRDRFVANGTLAEMLEEIATAVDANFDNPINIYFCFKKRALVITDKQTQFLDKNCEKSAGSYSNNY